MATPAAEMGVFCLTSMFALVLLCFTCSLSLQMTRVSLLILPKSGKCPAEQEREKGKDIVSSLRLACKKSWAVSIAQLHHGDLEWIDTVFPLVKER